jgi:hypothetical protein
MDKDQCITKSGREAKCLLESRTRDRRLGAIEDEKPVLLKEPFGCCLFIN